MRNTLVLERMWALRGDYQELHIKLPSKIRKSALKGKGGITEKSLFYNQPLRTADLECLILFRKLGAWYPIIMKQSQPDKDDSIKTYYAAMADAIRFIENGVKSGLSPMDSLSALKMQVSERRGIIWSSDWKKTQKNENTGKDKNDKR